MGFPFYVKYLGGHILRSHSVDAWGELLKSSMKYWMKQCPFGLKGWVCHWLTDRPHSGQSVSRHLLNS